jgi:hypothetical protein
MPKRLKKDSDDDHSDSDKPKHKKKMKKTTKGKKKPVKGKKKPRKIKIINPNLQTTAPPRPRPITHNQPMVSGHFDKNDAKDIEKIKENITKGAAVIQNIQEEIKEEKRARGRPKGSKNKTIITEETIIPVSAIKTRAQRKPKTPKTPIIEPLNITPKKKKGRPKKEEIPPEQTKVYTNPKNEPLPQFSLADDDDNLFNYMVPQSEQRQKISKTTKTYIGQKYRKNKPDDPDFDIDWRSYLVDNDIHPDDVEGMTKQETIQYVYNQLNGISQPAPIPAQQEMLYDNDDMTSMNDQQSEMFNIGLQSSTGGETLNNVNIGSGQDFDDIFGNYDDAQNQLAFQSSPLKEALRKTEDEYDNIMTDVAWNTRGKKLNPEQRRGNKYNNIAHSKTTFTGGDAPEAPEKESKEFEQLYDSKAVYPTEEDFTNDNDTYQKFHKAKNKGIFNSVISGIKSGISALSPMKTRGRPKGSTNKPKDTSLLNSIKEGKQLKKTQTNAKKPTKEKSAMEKAMDSRRQFIKEEDDNSDDDTGQWA